MKTNHLINQAGAYLEFLCNIIPTRRLGTQGNRDATAWFYEQVKSFGFAVERQKFDCIDSRLGNSDLQIGDQVFPIFSSPFSLSCSCETTLVAAGSLSELENITCNGKILLLHGEIAKEQLMPKGFAFYNPEEHQHIYRLLESKQPTAILAATSRNPDLAGAVYPFPMIEDGDFDIPNAYMKDVDGNKLLALTGKDAALRIQAERSPAWGENIVARKGGSSKKLVLCAHIDTKINTPGALDNASGVVILLQLAELLEEYSGDLNVELIAFNGEEYYNTPGEIEYLQRYEDDFSSILLAINLDDIGYISGRTAYSFYDASESQMNTIRSVYAEKDDFFEGPPWYQSDHGIFMAKGIPAMAITEEDVLELMAEITHTQKDTPAIIDLNKLAENAVALKEVIEKLDAMLAAE